MKAIIFDFDGVIQDTFNFHLNKIREFGKIDLSENDYRDLHNSNFHSNTSKLIKNIDWKGYKDFIYDDFINREF